MGRKRVDVDVDPGRLQADAPGASPFSLTSFIDEDHLSHLSWLWQHEHPRNPRLSSASNPTHALSLGVLVLPQLAACSAEWSTLSPCQPLETTAAPPSPSAQLMRIAEGRPQLQHSLCTLYQHSATVRLPADRHNGVPGDIPRHLRL